MSIAHRDEELHLILEGVSQCRDLQGEDVLDVPVQGKQAAEPQHMPKGAAQPLKNSDGQCVGQSLRRTRGPIPVNPAQAVRTTVVLRQPVVAANTRHVHKRTWDISRLSM